MAKGARQITLVERVNDETMSAGEGEREKKESSRTCKITSSQDRGTTRRW